MLQHRDIGPHSYVDRQVREIISLSNTSGDYFPGQTNTSGVTLMFPLHIKEQECIFKKSGPNTLLGQNTAIDDHSYNGKELRQVISLQVNPERRTKN